MPEDVSQGTVLNIQYTSSENCFLRNLANEKFYLEHATKKVLINENILFYISMICINHYFSIFHVSITSSQDFKAKGRNINVRIQLTSTEQYILCVNSSKQL